MRPCKESTAVQTTSIFCPTLNRLFTTPKHPSGWFLMLSFCANSLMCIKPSLFRSNSTTTPKSRISIIVPSYVSPISTSLTKSIIAAFASLTISRSSPNNKHLPVLYNTLQETKIENRQEVRISKLCNIFFSALARE